MKSSIVSHLLYTAVFLFGFALFFKGAEDFFLLFGGDIAEAEVVKIDTHHVRLGKRGSASKQYAYYEFEAPNGRVYSGNGDWQGYDVPQKGSPIQVRYLSFAPSVNAPSDISIIVGLLLTGGGGSFAYSVYNAWLNKMCRRSENLEQPSDQG